VFILTLGSATTKTVDFIYKRVACKERDIERATDTQLFFAYQRKLMPSNVLIDWLQRLHLETVDEQIFRFCFFGDRKINTHHINSKKRIQLTVQTNNSKCLLV
jgi:hypothetical protein